MLVGSTQSWLFHYFTYSIILAYDILRTSNLMERIFMKDKLVLILLGIFAIVVVSTIFPLLEILAKSFLVIFLVALLGGIIYQFFKS